MNIKLNKKIIEEMCGTVSFKRGDSFYRGKKVAIEHHSPDRCVATVIGVENFHVTVQKTEYDEIKTSCSCPKLASFDRSCQHVAAVLLSIYNQKYQSSLLIKSSENQEVLTEEVFTLFCDQPIRTSGHQPHFEDRQALQVEFTCKAVMVGNGKHMFGIQMKIDQIKVHHIRDFLNQVKDGEPFSLTTSFTFDQRIHCFEKDTDAVIHELINVVHDEKSYVDTNIDDDTEDINNHLLLIPPSSWRRLLSFLIKAPLVKLVYDGQSYDGIQLSDRSLPLQFHFTEIENKGYQLKVKGLDAMIVLGLYDIVLFDGTLVKLSRHDCGRLLELKKMLDNSNTNQIPIFQEQINAFMKKVVPGLKKLGHVKISKTITKQLMKTPLVAKLYLDRVRNRLLAGLEFHYEHIVLNPLESGDLPAGSMVIRDIEKEEEILQLMEGSEFAKTEGGYFLQNDELEYQFLYHIVPKLHKRVQIYATTSVRNRVFRGNARPQIRVKMKKERSNWLEFKFKMDGITDEKIHEVLLALEEKRKFYRLANGSFLSLETKEFADIQRFLHTAQVDRNDIANGLSIPLEQSLQLLDVVEEDKTFKYEKSFHQFLENIRNPDRLQFEIPKPLESILKNYQKQGFQWMKTLSYYGFGGILADDMGLGKTLQSISFILSELSNMRENKLPVLIACPSSLTYNWLNEMLKFAPNIHALVIDGNKKERVKIQQEELDEVDVVITSYPLLRADIKWYEKQNFHTVFFDEAQAFKNPVTQTFRAVKRIHADHRFALTGTPVENSLEELWAVFHIVFPALFLGLKEYSKLSSKTISRRIRPFLLRRLKEDVLSYLPRKVVSLESVELLPEQKELYTAYLAKLKHDTLKHLDKDTLRKNRIKVLAGLTRLRQICCHPSLFVDGYKGSSAKFEQLMQMIKEAKNNGRRVLIFSQFTKMLDLIGRSLAMKGLNFFYIDGQTPSEERVELCHRFNSGERDLFLISLKAGGTGLNLTGADTVILYDTWWNPAVEEQASDRTHRIGQQRIVQVIKLVASGTIEEKMNELQDKKRHLIEEVVEMKENSQSFLTEEDIRDLFG